MSEQDTKPAAKIAGIKQRGELKTASAHAASTGRPASMSIKKQVLRKSPHSACAYARTAATMA